MYSLESKCLPLISGKHFEIISSMNVYFLQTWVMYTFGVIDYCYDFTFNFLFHCLLNSIYWLIVYTLTCDCSCHSMNVEMRRQVCRTQFSSLPWRPGIKLGVARFDRRDCYPLSQREVFFLLCSLRDLLLDPFSSVALCLISKNFSCVLHVTFSLHPLSFHAQQTEHAVTSWKCNIYYALKFVRITLILNSLALSFLSPHTMLLFCLYGVYHSHDQFYRTMVWLEDFTSIENSGQVRQSFELCVTM